MYFLGIETSCDETAAAILYRDEEGFKIVSELVSSQTTIHERYGGVVPELASREHLTNLPLVVDEVLGRSDLAPEKITAIGVTRGPGLKGCLLMGTSFAKGLALAHKLPIIGVNHIEGHLHAVLLENENLKYPFLGLVVSGGHTEIIEVRELLKYGLIARTLDDAAGEAFDKSANLLGFPYPGGAALAALADNYGKTKHSLPKVMLETKGFSFSGLKTAIALMVKEEGASLKHDEHLRASLAFAIQEAIVEVLVRKVKEAVQETKLDQVVVTGGVAANRRLRERIGELKGIKSYFPSPARCMDNGAMIALVAALYYERGVINTLDFSVISRWPVETLSQ